MIVKSRRRAALLPALLLALLAAGNLAGAQPAAETSGRDFWTPLFLLDYGIGLAGLYTGAQWTAPPRERALLGPSFDPAEPAVVLAPELSRSLGRPFRPEKDWTVPTRWLELAAAGQLLLVPANELLATLGTGRPISGHRMHHSLLAVAQATAAASGLVRLTKVHTGRLRPDFQDRLRYVYCSLPDPAGLDCAGVDPARLFSDPEEALHELEDGRLSFVSGHAAMAMVVATNLALQLGSRWVWNENASPASRRAAVAGMGALFGTATFVAVSRTGLMDGVHHTSDVIVGSLAGTGIGGLFYWLHFDSGGEPRADHWLSRGGRSGGRSGGLAAGIQPVRLHFDGTRIVVLAGWRPGRPALMGSPHFPRPIVYNQTSAFAGTGTAGYREAPVSPATARR